MEKKNRNTTAERQELLKKQHQQEAERAAILMKADEIKEEVLDFGIDGQLEFKSEIADLMLEQIDNPDEKYSLYYKVATRLLLKHLPKGEAYKDARELIYEEKNTFLTRGHRKNSAGIRGADSRMSYIPDIVELVNVITEWITSRGTMFELYLKLRDLNESKGYGTGELND